MLFAAGVICGSAGHCLWVTSGCLSPVARRFPGEIANPQKHDKIGIHCQSLVRAHRDVHSSSFLPCPLLPHLLCSQKKGSEIAKIFPIFPFFSFSRRWAHSSLHWEPQHWERLFQILFQTPSLCTVLIIVVVDKKCELIHPVRCLRSGWMQYWPY